MRKLSCGIYCDHTDEQHIAFDAGVEAGEAGKEESVNPYSDPNLAFDWSFGYSVGLGNYLGKKAS